MGLVAEGCLHEEHRLFLQIPHKHYLDLRYSQHIPILNGLLNHILDLTLQHLILQKHLAYCLPTLTNNIHFLRDGPPLVLLNRNRHNRFGKGNGFRNLILTEVYLLTVSEVDELESEVLFGGFDKTEHEGLFPGEEFDVPDGL